MKISFITTFLNEEETILRFLESLLSQTLMPDEVILVDGGSTDNTLPLVKKYIAKKKGKTAIVLLSLKGNRAVGRNAAIKKASGDIIACSDAGNILDALWLEEICKPFKNRSIFCGVCLLYHFYFCL